MTTEDDVTNKLTRFTFKRSFKRLWKMLRRHLVTQIPAKFIHKVPHRIYDCLLFYRELDILEIRLKELFDYVDVFVILESTTSFIGEPNEPYLLQNWDRFKPYQSKMRHVLITEVPETAYQAAMRPDVLISEAWHRNQLLRGLYDAAPDDLILISDADEIPAEVAINRAGLLLSLGEPMVLLEQSWRLLYLNAIVTKQPWLGTAITTRIKLSEEYDDEPNQMWAKRWYNSDTAKIKSGGWHFSFMGGDELIRMKMRGLGHPDMERDFLAALARHHFNGFDFRPSPNADLPYSIQDSNDRWDHLLYDEKAYEILCEKLHQRPHQVVAEAQTSHSDKGD